MTSEELTSWKEIADFLGKGVRTVQRWEAELGLPVHRANTRAKGIVRASKGELRLWTETRWSQRSEGRVQQVVLHSPTQQIAHVSADAVEVSRRMRARRQQVLEQFRAARIRLLSELQTSIKTMSEDYGSKPEEDLRKVS